MMYEIVIDTMIDNVLYYNTFWITFWTLYIVGIYLVRTKYTRTLQSDYDLLQKDVQSLQRDLEKVRASRRLLKKEYAGMQKRYTALKKNHIFCNYEREDMIKTIEELENALEHKEKHIGRMQSRSKRQRVA